MTVDSGETQATKVDALGNGYSASHEVEGCSVTDTESRHQEDMRRENSQKDVFAHCVCRSVTHQTWIMISRENSVRNEGNDDGWNRLEHQAMKRRRAVKFSKSKQL